MASQASPKGSGTDHECLGVAGCIKLFRNCEGVTKLAAIGSFSGFCFAGQLVHAASTMVLWEKCMLLCDRLFAGFAVAFCFSGRHVKHLLQRP